MEKRRFPRYQLAKPLTGVVEQEGQRYRGTVINLSAGGFYLRLAEAPKKPLAIQSDSDYGEIIYAGRTASGFGNIMRVDKYRGGVSLAFAWDRGAMDAESINVIGEVIQEQEQKRALGRVTTAENEVVVGGHVSSALAYDIFSALRALSGDERNRNAAQGADRARLSLKGCTSVDSSGVEMLLALRDRGVAIVGIEPEIDAVIRRFQIGGAADGKGGSDAG